MYSRVKKFLSLSFDEKLIFVEAVALLPVIRVVLRLFGLRGSQRFLGLAALGRNIDRAELGVERISYLVCAAANNGLLRANCLERSLLLWSLLRRRGYAADIRIGVSNEAKQFKAHAWVEMNGVVLNDRLDVAAEFAPFSGAIDLSAPASKLRSMQSREYGAP